MEMASPGNRHCAKFIGALSFPIVRLSVTLLNVKIPLFVALNCTIEEQQYPTYEKARTDRHQAVTFDYVLQTRTTWLQRST